MNQPQKNLQSHRVSAPFIYAGLAFALTAGIGFGLWLAVSPVNGGLRGNNYSAIAQAHAHALLFGWLGLTLWGLVLGVRTAQDAQGSGASHRTSLALWLILLGIALQVALQIAVAYIRMSPLLRGGLVLSAVLELVGVLVAITFLQTGNAPDSTNADGLMAGALAKFGVVALGLAFVFNLLGVWNVATQARMLMPVRYTSIVYNLMVLGAAVPLGILLCARVIQSSPGSTPDGRGWNRLAGYFAIGLTLRVMPNLLAIVDDGLILTGRILRANYLIVLLFDALAVLGTVMLGVVIFVSVIRLFRFRMRGTRMEGRTENLMNLILYSALVWLAMAVVLDLIRVLPIINERLAIPQDAARHAMLMGYVALMLIGVTTRVVLRPNGSRVGRSIAAVLWLLILGNLAAFLRVVPQMLSTAQWTEWTVALSGILGWATLLLLAGVLIFTGRSVQGE